MKKGYLAIIIIIALTVFSISAAQWFVLRKAHSTFDNYYAFRGCTQLLQKTATYGVCKTNPGKTIKIVKYQGKWYLDGDLPWACVGRICFGL